jgi:hypothetical protein
VLPFVRDFLARVRRGRRLELALAIGLGLCALAMAGTGKHAYTGEHCSGPAERPCGEPTHAARVAAIAHAPAPRAEPAELALASPRAARRSPRAADGPHLAPVAPVLRVRGPPARDLAAYSGPWFARYTPRWS